MRKLLLPLAVVGLLSACGGGDDSPTVDAADDTTSSSSTATTVPGGDGPGTTVTISPGGSPDPNATTPTIPTVDTTPIDPSTVATLPPAPDPGPTDPGFPPAAPGQYTYATTGNMGGRPVNETQTYTVTSLGPSDVRYAAPSQVLDLQYRSDGVYLRQLTAQLGGFAITFQSPDGVLFLPIPLDAGRTWDWTLTDTTGQLTAAWHGTTLPAEHATNGTGPFPRVDATVRITGNYDTGILGRQDVDGTMDVRLLVDPALRLPAQLFQKTTITKPALAQGLGAETTSTYTGFTPA